MPSTVHKGKPRHTTAVTLSIIDICQEKYKKCSNIYKEILHQSHTLLWHRNLISTWQARAAPVFQPTRMMGLPGQSALSSDILVRVVVNNWSKQLDKVVFPLTWPKQKKKKTEKKRVSQEKYSLVKKVLPWETYLYTLWRQCQEQTNEWSNMWSGRIVCKLYQGQMVLSQ